MNLSSLVKNVYYFIIFLSPEKTIYYLLYATDYKVFGRCV